MRTENCEGNAKEDNLEKNKKAARKRDGRQKKGKREAGKKETKWKKLATGKEQAGKAKEVTGDYPHDSPIKIMEELSPPNHTLMGFRGQKLVFKGKPP